MLDGGGEQGQCASGLDTSRSVEKGKRGKGEKEIGGRCSMWESSTRGCRGERGERGKAW